ncbi:MAG: nucleoside 2-deoxyribosyltransferase [Phycisphaerae bacterium]|nr:nucleoside 2-deoxyribosyltransferase [Phycisphaerae bacterium]
MADSTDFIGGPHGFLAVSPILASFRLDIMCVAVYSSGSVSENCGVLRISKGGFMNKRPYKIYCAGPLFNPKEREEMEHIAVSLERAGYAVFLPQRDGLEFARLLPVLLRRNVSSEGASKILNNAIFCLDVFHITDSHGLVLNMNGRVPDEGAMVEAGIAWAHDKTLVIFKNDDRSLLEGNCNPMVLGLSNFEYVSEYEEVPSAFSAKFSNRADEFPQFQNSRFEAATQNGKEISSCLASEKDARDITDLLIDLFGRGNVKLQKSREGVVLK